MGFTSALVAVVPILLAGHTTGRELRYLLGWIGAGSAVFGLTGWLAATAVGVSLVGGVAAGLAAGGGVGAVVRLFAFSSGPSPRETVTVAAPDKESMDLDPEPADLFEASPDPILYYDGDDKLTVRAVNPAFESAFGISETTVEMATLGDAVMATEPTPLVDAATNGESVETVVDCETPAGDSPYYVRVVPVGDGQRTRGYVVYTAHNESYGRS